MIRFSRVVKHFGAGASSVTALYDLDLFVPEGQMCALMGPSGAGKSTVLHLAGGLARPDSGSVVLGDRDLAQLSGSDLALLRRREIGIIFQFFALLPYLSAYENVALSLRLDGVARAEERRRVDRALDLVGLGHRATHKPYELSGGEMQRVAIARALVIEPRVVLADEPTGNLDSVAGREIMDLLRDINEETKVTMMIVTHDPIWAAVCDRVVRLVDGKITEDIPLPGDSEEPRGPGMVH